MATRTGSEKGTSATAAADSQAQTATGKRSGDLPRTAAEEIQYFDCTIVKVDAEGRDVMSDHLAPGETLRSATTDRYATVKRETRRDGKREDKDVKEGTGQDDRDKDRNG